MRLYIVYAMIILFVSNLSIFYRFHKAMAAYVTPAHSHAHAQVDGVVWHATSQYVIAAQAVARKALVSSVH